MGINLNNSYQVEVLGKVTLCLPIFLSLDEKCYLDSWSMNSKQGISMEQ